MWRLFPWILIPVAVVAAGAARRGSWAARREARADRRAWRREHRGHSLFGMLWGAFWICVVLAFVFGGPETRHAMIGTVRTAWLAVCDFFRELFGPGVQ